jgi:hypothetical protein
MSRLGPILWPYCTERRDETVDATEESVSVAAHPGLEGDYSVRGAGKDLHADAHSGWGLLQQSPCTVLRLPSGGNWIRASRLQVLSTPPLTLSEGKT